MEQLVAAILDADVALAGLLLVFVGLLYTRGGELSSLRGDRAKNVARLGVLPLGLSLWCAWVCVNYLSGDAKLLRTIIIMFRVDVILTGLYACIVAFVFL